MKSPTKEEIVLIVQIFGPIGMLFLFSLLMARGYETAGRVLGWSFAVAWLGGYIVVIIRGHRSQQQGEQLEQTPTPQESDVWLPAPTIGGSSRTPMQETHGSTPPDAAGGDHGDIDVSN